MITVTISHTTFSAMELEKLFQQHLPPGAVYHIESENPKASKAVSGKLKLSNRETVVYERLVQGESAKLIAANLQVSTHTVFNHLRSIYKKLGVNSKGQAISLYFNHMTGN